MDDKPTDTKLAISQIESLQSPTEADLSALKGDYEIKTTQDSRFAALAAKHKPNPLSRGLLMLYPILFVAFMNSAANGFDGNTFGGVSAVPNFQARFGTNVAASQGFLAAIYILGECSDSMVLCSANDKLQAMFSAPSSRDRSQTTSAVARACSSPTSSSSSAPSSKPQPSSVAT